MSPSPAVSRRSKTSAPPRAAASPATRIVVLVATRKGAWIFQSDRRRKTWSCDGPISWATPSAI